MAPSPLPLYPQGAHVPEGEGIIPLPPVPLRATDPSHQGRGISFPGASVRLVGAGLLCVAGGLVGEASDELHLKLGVSPEQLKQLF